MSREDASQIVEQGDIFFFYRPKVGAEEVSSTEDVQRFYMVTAHEEKDRKYRLFILGRKKLPEIVEGKSTLTQSVATSLWLKEESLMFIIITFP
jgi:predicted RND superfamily exporter protein